MWRSAQQWGRLRHEAAAFLRGRKPRGTAKCRGGAGRVEEKDKCQLRMARCGWRLRPPDADLPPPFYPSASLCIDFPDTQPRYSGRWTEIKGGPAAEHSREADTVSAFSLVILTPPPKKKVSSSCRVHFCVSLGSWLPSEPLQLTPTHCFALSLFLFSSSNCCENGINN